MCEVSRPNEKTCYKPDIWQISKRNENTITIGVECQCIGYVVGKLPHELCPPSNMFSFCSLDRNKICCFLYHWTNSGPFITPVQWHCCKHRKLCVIGLCRLQSHLIAFWILLLNLVLPLQTLNFKGQGKMWGMGRSFQIQNWHQNVELKGIRKTRRKLPTQHLLSRWKFNIVLNSSLAISSGHVSNVIRMSLPSPVHACIETTFYFRPEMNQVTYK